ncbi:MAG: hypothetical protein K2Y23_15910 [Cyanobacteria bacterium]|nr:hypothetical protein [Cyanobacteriota bacterium]
MHALLIKSQQRWYGQIDARLMTLLAIDALSHTNAKPRWWRSTHGIYQWMHWSIALLLAVMTSLMIMYSFGSFADLPLPTANR